MSSSPNETKKFLKDQVLFKEGEKNEFLYRLTKGKVNLYKKAGERIIPVMTVSAPGLIGDESCLMKDHFIYSAIAVDECEVILIPKSQIQEMFKKSPDWVKKLFLNLSERVDETMDLITTHQIVHSSLHDDREFGNDEEFKIRQKL